MIIDYFGPNPRDMISSLNPREHIMNIALIGATGRVGSRIATELLNRGHKVTGIVRNTQGATPQAGVSLVQGDANDPSTLAPLLAGHDAVISASRFDGADA